MSNTSSNGMTLPQSLRFFANMVEINRERRDTLMQALRQAADVIERTPTVETPADPSRELLGWRAERAIGLLEDAPSAAREALSGGYDHEFASALKATSDPGTTKLAIAMLERFRDGRWETGRHTHESLLGPRDQLLQEGDWFDHAVKVLRSTLSENGSGDANGN